MANFMQKLVSKKKRRFQEDGFDLDMTFITKNVVAMGFPAEKMEGVYRNKMSDVKRFFDSRYKDHYKVYNLCSERKYDPAKFYGRVEHYPFDDHNAPPFPLMKPFCDDVQAYLAEDSRNVAVIHCKAGKGRTGVMICAFLLHCKMWQNTNDALDFYGHARTTNGKGVTIPSQIRYVHYYGKYVRDEVAYKPVTLIFKSIRLCGIPGFASNGACSPYFTIRQGPEKVILFKSQVFEGITKDDKEAVLKLDAATPICGDVKVEFFHKTKAGKDKMFHMWFNTFFVEKYFVRCEKESLDKANKDKKHKIFPADFAVEFYFDSPEGSADSGPSPPGPGTSSGTGTVYRARAESQPASAIYKPGEGPEDDDDADEMPQHQGHAAAAAASSHPPMPQQASTMSMEDLWDDKDLTSDEEDEDEWLGLPISDV